MESDDCGEQSVCLCLQSRVTHDAEIEIEEPFFSCSVVGKKELRRSIYVPTLMIFG